MDTLVAITARRSIREYENRPVARETLEAILESATKAPSGKNRQPWRFVVLQGSKKAELAAIMAQAAAHRKEQGLDIGSSELSIKAITQASAVIAVFNAFSAEEADYNHYRLLTDTQSIGAAVQNMLLAAQSFGVGTLWMCDIFYAEREIRAWLNRSSELVAAVAIGHAAQAPWPRSRKAWQEVTEWEQE